MDKIITIELENVVPHAFRDSGTAESGVWRSSLTFHRGGRYIVQSRSGGGKSSLCSYIFGLRNDYDGTIKINGTEIRTFSIDHWCSLRRSHLALLPQDMRLFSDLTALENVQIKNTLTSMLSLSEIIEMFELLGIADKMATPVKLLSIGQQQRVALIRTLCQPFDFLLLDEPVSHLDPENNQAAARMIESRAGALGAAVIVTSVGNPLMLTDITSTISL